MASVKVYKPSKEAIEAIELKSSSRCCKDCVFVVPLDLPEVAGISLNQKDENSHRTYLPCYHVVGSTIGEYIKKYGKEEVTEAELVAIMT